MDVRHLNQEAPRTMATRQERTLAETLRELLEERLDDEPGGPFRWVRSFADEGLLTSDEGLVVRFHDGSEFQVSIVASRAPEGGWDEEDESED
jgi:hypothetical protein